MAARTKGKTNEIDTLMEQATSALESTSYFRAEALAVQALQLARQAEDWDRLARITLPLQEARRQQRQLAFDTNRLIILEEPFDEETIEVEMACYLIEPPLVGADARRLRLRAMEQEVPAVVVCREPMTQLRLWPVVAICPGMTYRHRIDPPADPEMPDLQWMAEAVEQLGDFAIEQVDPGIATLKRVDALITAIEAIPFHETVYQALAAECRTAEREALDAAQA